MNNKEPMALDLQTMTSLAYTSKIFAELPFSLTANSQLELVGQSKSSEWLT